VQHDIDLRPVDLASKKNAPVKEDDAPAEQENIQPSTMPPTTCPATIRSAPRPPQKLKTITPAGLHRLRREFFCASKNGRSQISLPPMPSRISAATIQIGHLNPPDTVVIADAGQLRVPSLIVCPFARSSSKQAAPALK